MEKPEYTMYLHNQLYIDHIYLWNKIIEDLEKKDCNICYENLEDIKRYNIPEGILDKYGIDEDKFELNFYCFACYSVNLMYKRTCFFCPLKFDKGCSRNNSLWRELDHYFDLLIEYEYEYEYEYAFENAIKYAKKIRDTGWKSYKEFMGNLNKIYK